MGLKFAPRPTTPPPPRPTRPRRPRVPTPVVPQPTEVSPFGARVREAIGAGIQDEQHAVQVGQLVQEEFDQRYGEEYARLQQAFEAVKPQMDRANAQLRLYTRPSAATRARFDALMQKGRAAEQALETFTEQSYHTLLSEIRPLGGDLRFKRGNHRVVQALVEDVSQHVPRDWIEASNRAGTLGTAELREAGSTMGDYTAGASQIRVKLKGRTHVSDARSTALHELNHRMEHTTPRLVELEQQFYARRTAGEAHAPLPHYRQGTDGKVDAFVVPYMGRDYRVQGSGRAHFFELLSMGSEGVLLSAYEMRRDVDMLHFILGLYAGV